MSINIQNLESIQPDHSFATINERIADFIQVSSVESKAVADAADGRMQRLLAVYAAVRPILGILAGLPLLPPIWRTAIRVFVASLDEITAAPVAGGQDFKAGKDL